MKSNHSGRVPHVPTQPAANPSSRSILSRDKRLPLDIWNTFPLQENVFCNQFSTVFSSRNQYQRIHDSMTPGATGLVPVRIGTGTPVARDEDRIKGTIPLPTFARRPSNMSSLLPVEIPQNSMVGQKRQLISELQFDKFHTLSTFSCWKIRFKNQVATCSDFPSEAMLWRWSIHWMN